MKTGDTRDYDLPPWGDSDTNHPWREISALRTQAMNNLDRVQAEMAEAIQAAYRRKIDKLWNAAVKRVFDETSGREWGKTLDGIYGFCGVESYHLGATQNPEQFIDRLTALGGPHGATLFAIWRAKHG